MCSLWFDFVTNEYEFVDDGTNVFCVRTEVEVVEVEDCTSYGLRKEIVFDHNYRLFVRKSRTSCTMMRVKMMTLAVPKIV